MHPTPQTHHLPKKVFIKNLGCKVNLADGHGLAYEFKTQGYELTQNPKEAHITVLNTCSVTQNAEKEARYLLRKYSNENPADSLRVVTGCYAQIHSGGLLEMPEVSYVVPNESKGELVSLVHRITKDFHAPTTTKFPHHLTPVKDNKQGHFKSATAFFAPHFSEKSRAFLKIQDGCNDFCTYCQIPFARGASRSVPPHKIIQEVERLLRQNISEIILTGIHIGEWGRDLPQTPTIVSLLESISKRLTDHLPARLRLSSLEPSEFRPPLARWIKAQQNLICRHLHFPMQSGSARILKLMGRKYTAEQYRHTLEKAREAFQPYSAHLSADVMVGFPGETDDDFKQTVDLIEACRLTSLHVFPYSARPRTRALRLPDHLPPEIIRDRSKILRQLSERHLQDFYRSSIGQEAEVLWENKYDQEGRPLGKTSHYLTVCALQKDKNFIEPGSISRVHLKGLISAKKLLAVL